VEHYVLSQDKPGSVKAAGYSPKDDKVALIRAHSLLRHPHIKVLVALGLGYEPQGAIMTKREVLLTLSDLIRKTKKPIAASKLIAQFVELRGWKPEEDVDIDAVVREAERKRKENK